MMTKEIYGAYEEVRNAINEKTLKSSAKYASVIRDLVLLAGEVSYGAL